MFLTFLLYWRSFCTESEIFLNIWIYLFVIPFSHLSYYLWLENLSLYIYIYYYIYYYIIILHNIILYYYIYYIYYMYYLNPINFRAPLTFALIFAQHECAKVNSVQNSPFFAHYHFRLEFDYILQYFLPP